MAQIRLSVLDAPGKRLLSKPPADTMLADLHVRAQPLVAEILLALLSRPFVPVPEIDPKSGPPFGVRSCCQEVIQEEIKKLTQERTSLRKEMKSNRKKAKNAAKRKKRLVKARSSRYSGPVMSFALACIPPCTTCTGSQVAFQSGPPNPDPSQGER